MSAHIAFLAPIGSILAWSDGQPRPPERHRKKLSAWKTNNSSGRLIRRADQRGGGDIARPPSFTLHEGDYGGGGMIAIRVHRTFSLDTRLMFTLVERPLVGSCRVFDRPGGYAELVHFDASRLAAEQWLTTHGYPSAVLEDVTADEIAADVVEGRPRHDFSPQSTGGIAPNGRRLPANAPSDRDDRASDYRQDDRVDPTTWPSQIRLSPWQAAGTEILSLPLPCQSCRDDRRASAGDRRALSQTRASGGCNRTIARTLVCGSDRAGLQGAETIGGPDCRTAAGGLTKIWSRSLHDFLSCFGIRDKPLGRSVLRFCGGLNQRPSGSRPLSRRVAAGHAACRKTRTRASQGFGPACPRTGFSRSGLPGP